MFKEKRNATKIEIPKELFDLKDLYNCKHQELKTVPFKCFIEYFPHTYGFSPLKC